MRNLILLLAIPIFLFSNCDPNSSQTCDPDCDTLTKAELIKLDTIPQATVIAMAAAYYNASHNIDSNILRMMTMSGPLLKKLLIKQARVRFIVGQYLTPPPPGKPTYTVVIQLMHKTSGRLVYYDINEFDNLPAFKVSTPVCPPPKDCDITATD